MKKNVLAFSVHLFTAAGAVLALFAMLAAGNQEWANMFLWLMAALVVDGLDGPLARHFEVKKYARHWDGQLMDLIIDYLTYVFIPAYALAQSGILPAWEGWMAATVIVLTGVVYFSDTRMKTEDNSFSGFPGGWNMVVLVLFATKPDFWVMLLVIAVLALAQFFNLKFVHPVRTLRWRAVSLSMIVIWLGCAFWIGWLDFDAPYVAQVVLLASSGYLLFAGILQQVFPVKSGLSE